MNWFALAVAVLQFLAAADYLYRRQIDFAGIWFLYGVANLITIRMAMKG
jgi:hypothetical protein